MRAQVIFRADSTEALKAHPIWQQIIDLFCPEESQALEVEEIRLLDDEPEE